MPSSFDFNGLLNALGIILLASGAFAGLSVHAAHIGVHQGDHSHVQEIITGIVLLFSGVLILILNNRIPNGKVPNIKVPNNKNA